MTKIMQKPTPMVLDEMLKKNDKIYIPRFRCDVSLLHEISVTTLYSCSAVLVIAIYTEGGSIILPSLIVDGVSLFISLIMKRL